jgi:dipeptidyl aminopeptidase/acylaminoacyl peptidase
MKLFNCSFYLMILLATGNVSSGQPPQLKHWSPEQCMKMKNVTSVRISPDGKKIVYTIREAMMTDDKSEYINQVFIANSDGTNAIALTKNDKDNANPKWSNDGKWIAFASNRDGKNNLYVLSAAGGEAEKITDSKTGVGNFEWSGDGNAIAFLMGDGPDDKEEKNKKGKNDWYFYEEALKQNRLFVLWLNKKDSTGKRLQKLITKENRNINAFSWSGDGKTIAYSHGRSTLANDNIYSDISLANIETAESRVLVNTAAGETNPQYSPDGKWIAFTCSDNPVVWGGKTVVKIIPSSGGTVTALAETPNTGAGLLGWSADGKYVYVTDANKTLNSIYKLSADGKEMIEWNKGSIDLMGAASLNATSTHIGFILQNITTPPEAFVSTLDNYSPVKVSSVSDIAGKPIPKTEIVRWKSFDGKEIEGILTYPIGYQAGQKVPLILNIHGGPAGVFSQNFVAANQGSYPIAAFAEMGYAVLRPNPRGSTGYGVTFRRSNERDWGGNDFKDLMLGVDEIIKMGIADKSKLGVMGWSYGGYMSSWIVGHTDRFKAASIGAPVVNLVSQDGTSDISEFLPSYYRKYHWEDFDVYTLHSPIRYVSNVKTPVMLQHGEADARVPFSQSMEFYLALKRRNVPVRLLGLPRQPHGPVEPKMVLKVMQTNVEWFDKYFSEKKGF